MWLLEHILDTDKKYQPVLGAVCEAAATCGILPHPGRMEVDAC
jgi:hypothetical protein